MYEIWEQLQANGQTDLTFEQFKAAYSTEDGQKNLHSSLASANMTDLSFKDFSSAYFVDSKPNIISADEIISEPNKTIAIPAKQPALTQESPTKKPKFQTKYKIPQVEDVVAQESIEQAEQEQKEILQAPRKARASSISAMENVFDNGGYQNLNENFKNLKQDEF